MKVSIIIPSRSRPYQFKEAIKSYVHKAKYEVNIIALFDHDDEYLNVYLQVYKQMMCFEYIISQSKNQTKIKAINNAAQMTDFDILIVCADDMFAVAQNYDDKIITDMQNHFADTDGCLWYENGGRKKPICLQSIIGRTYYDRFEYVYHPSYVSLWCDNEFTDVAVDFKKIYYEDTVLFEHRHPSHYVNGTWDTLYERNEKFFESDRLNYERRKAKNFE